MVIATRGGALQTWQLDYRAVNFDGVFCDPNVPGGEIRCSRCHEAPVRMYVSSVAFRYDMLVSDGFDHCVLRMRFG